MRGSRLGISANGDPATGVALTIAAVPLWVQLSLMGKCRGRVERSLARLDSDSAEAARSRMKLCAAVGWSLMYRVGALEGPRRGYNEEICLAVKRS